MADITSPHDLYLKVVDHRGKTEIRYARVWSASRYYEAFVSQAAAQAAKDKHPPPAISISSAEEYAKWRKE